MFPLQENCPCETKLATDSTFEEHFPATEAIWQNKRPTGTQEWNIHNNAAQKNLDAPRK